MLNIKTTIVIAIMMIVSVVSLMSCDKRDDDLPDSKIEKVSFDEKKPIVAKSANSIYFPTCSSPATENTMSWTNGTFNLNLATTANQDKKYIWRQSVEVGGVPKFFKVQIKNKSTVNYPITVRLVGQDVITFGADRWFVINDDGKCKDLLINNSFRLFDNPSTTSDEGWNADYVQFEVLVPNRAAAGKSATFVPIEIKLCAYTSSACF